MALSPESPLIKGQEYSWAGIKINLAGADIIGVSSIEFTDDEVIEAIYGAGNRPIAVGRGPVEYSATIGLHASELERLRAASPTGRLQDLPFFAVTLEFQAGLKIMTIVLEYCLCKNDGISSEQGDTSIVTDVELFVGNIRYR